jgi:hypothetical protein
MRPEVYFALKDLVWFEKDVREHFAPGSTAKKRPPKKKVERSGTSVTKQSGDMGDKLGP